MRHLLSCCVALGLALAACDDDEDPASGGGLTIVVESDLSIPKDIDRVKLEVKQEGKILLEIDERLGEHELLIPAQFHVPAIGNDRPVTVHGVALLDGVPRIERSAITPVPRTHVGMLRLPFKYLCDGTAEADGSSTCDGGETCVLGSCRSATVPASALSEGSPGEPGSEQTRSPVTRGDGGGAACFDLLACFAAAESVELDLDECTFPLPAGASAGRFNVALTLPLGGAGLCDAQSCFVVLDRDEGWSLEGGTVQLPASVCRRIETGDVTGVAVTSECRAKNAITPLCGEWSSATAPIDSPAPPPAIGDACEGAAARSCGQCGSQTRSCRNGRWSSFSSCSDEGECTPDSTRPCDGGGTQVCGGDCAWRQCVLPTAPECDGPAMRSCGSCGTQQRACTAGLWADWGACSDQGECSPDDSQACGSGGTQVCGGDCSWGACTGQVCSGEATRECGRCGVQSRSCDAETGSWSAWSSCSGEGSCAPTDTQACGAGGTQTCGSDCEWGLECAGQLCDGASLQTCGECNLGTQTRSCDANSASWSDWSTCSGGGACAQGETRPCGAGGTQTCSSECQWPVECPGQVCAGASSQACGHCELGTQTRSCDANSGTWSDWSTCSGGGACAPDETRGCGSGGTQTCGDNCQWLAECAGQMCDGPSSQVCGNCQLGSQVRNCDPGSGTWSDWSQCSGGGLCAPSDTRSCGTGGMQTCGSNCQWGTACSGQSCTVPLSEACGNCGTRTRLCDSSTGQPGPWSACMNEGVCTPTASQACGTGGTQACTPACQWGSCTGQTCSGPTSQPCGHCGTQTRTCNNGTFSPWGACTGERATPPGAGAGGYLFDASSNQGWTHSGMFDGDSNTRVGNTNLNNAAVFWDNANNVGSAFNADPTTDTRGSARAWAVGPPPFQAIGYSAPSGYWRIDLMSPQLADDSPFQNHTRVRFAVLQRFSGSAPSEGDVQVQALYEVEKCDGTTSYFRDVTGGSTVFCDPPNGTWTNCEFQITPTSTHRIKRVFVRVFFQSGIVWANGGVWIDEIQAL